MQHLYGKWKSYSFKAKFNTVFTILILWDFSSWQWEGENGKFKQRWQAKLTLLHWIWHLALLRSEKLLSCSIHSAPLWDINRVRIHCNFAHSRTFNSSSRTAKVNGKGKYSFVSTSHTMNWLVTEILTGHYALTWHLTYGPLKECDV
jgi:hypothetical protein